MNSRKHILLAALGATLFAAGLVTALLSEGTSHAWLAVPYLGVGIGAGLFGANVGGLIQRRMMIRHPDLARQAQIEQNDERNIALRSQAKAKAFDLMQYSFGAILIALALLGVDLYAVLLLVAAYLFVVFAQFYFLHRLQETM